MNDNKINRFWVFFEEIASEILAKTEDEKIIATIDDEVSKLGNITWEYGPLENDYYFCLSPNFKFDLIPYTDYAISLSPNLNGWRFLSGKPQKLDATDEICFLETDGSEISVSTKNWRAVTYKFKDGTYDIDFLIDMNSDEDTKYLALNLAMVNLLGEINYLRKVENIKIVERFDSNTNQKGIKFSDLIDVIT